MEDVIQKMKDGISSKLAGSPARTDTLKAFENLKESGYDDNFELTIDFLDFLKNKEDIGEIYLLIKNKKLSNNEIRKRLKTYLKDPENLRDFLNSILDTNKGKKSEEKESTGSGSSGGYSQPLFTTKRDIVRGVKTVREQLEMGETTEEGNDDMVKKETKEATSSSSSGQYSQPSMWAKSMSKKNFRGYSKTQLPGGKFVQVKKKCKKFPYCNQGDIKALKIFENESVQNAIDSVSSSYGLDKEYISEIVYQKIRKRQK
jgi:hypothetical protein